ncbi:MAG: hypothetical protein KKB70_10840 [Proteobacteria bacterium]|nr:hypothetical protein [Pseudomonadota bacterium]
MKAMILAITVAVALLCAASFSTAMDDTGLLIKEDCTRCHGLGKVCQNLGKDLVWWESTVSRMQSRMPDLSEVDAANMAAYLAAPPDEFAKSCQ